MTSPQDALTAGIIEWRLQVCMANTGIRFASELQRQLLTALGADRAPSESQVSRLLRSRPERLNLTVLAGLCAVLDCDPGDLMRYQRPLSGAAADTH